MVQQFFHCDADIDPTYPSGDAQGNGMVAFDELSSHSEEWPSEFAAALDAFIYPSPPYSISTDNSGTGFLPEYQFQELVTAQTCHLDSNFHQNADDNGKPTNKTLAPTATDIFSAAQGILAPDVLAMSTGQLEATHQAAAAVVEPMAPSAGTVCVSTSFAPGAHSAPHDLILSSKDDVLFCVHKQIIRSSSPNAFAAYLGAVAPTTSPSPSWKGNHILSTPPDTTRDTISGGVVKIPEPSPILNIILHTLYYTSCAPQSPTLDQLTHAVHRLPFYDITPKSLITPLSPTYSLLLSHAPLKPLALYALAAQHELEDLAVQTSSHLLGVPLHSIDDDLAAQIGPVYLKRLFMLHMTRNSTLKELVLQVPHPHAPTKSCNFEEQKKLTRAWVLASAYLVWDAQPDVSVQHIQRTFEGVIDRLTCAQCEKTSRALIRDMVVRWAALKCTI